MEITYDYEFGWLEEIKEGRVSAEDVLINRIGQPNSTEEEIFEYLRHCDFRNLLTVCEEVNLNIAEKALIYKWDDLFDEVMKLGHPWFDKDGEALYDKFYGDIVETKKLLHFADLQEMEEILKASLNGSDPIFDKFVINEFVKNISVGEFTNLLKRSDDNEKRRLFDLAGNLLMENNTFKRIIFHNEELLLLMASVDNSVLLDIDKSLYENEEFALKAIKIDGYVLKILPDKFKDKEEFVFEAVSNYPSAFKYASQRLQENKELLKLNQKYLGDMENRPILDYDWFVRANDNLNKLKREEEILARLKENEVVPEFANKKNEVRQVKRKI